MNWPGAGNDPFYLANPSDNTARRTYYGINAVFNMKADGVLGNSGGSYQSYYNQRNPVPSPVNIDIGMDVASTIDVTVYVTAESNYSANNLTLQVGLCSVEYNIPPGNWTYTHCMHAMLDMANDAAGINFNISEGETVELTCSFPFPAYPPGINTDNLEIIAFVQNNSTQEVLQSELSLMPVDYPDLELDEVFVTDEEPGGNNNGRPEPGEDCELSVELQNGYIYAQATGITAVLSSEDPDITVTNSTASFADAGPGEVVDNFASPFAFSVDENLEAHNVDFNLHIESNGGAYSWDETFRIMVGIPSLVIVDDDEGEIFELEIETSLDILDAPYDHYDVFAMGTPTSEELSLYQTIIWITGQSTSPIDEDEQILIAEFLDNGGNMLMSSENLGDDLAGTAWYNEYMHATHNQDHISFTVLDGVEGNFISDGTDLVLSGGAYFPDSQSSVYPAADAEEVYTYPNDQVGAVAFAGSYMLVYAAFPIECVNEETYTYTRRSELLQNILAWFDETMTVSMPNLTAAPSSVISVPLTTEMINSANPITSFDISMYWNPGVLSPADPLITLDGTILPGDWTTDITSSFGFDLAGSCSGTTPLTGEGDLLYINFNVIGADGSFSDLDIVSFEYNEPLLLAIGDGSVTVSATSVGNQNDPMIPEKFAITSIYPNPFNPQTSISFDLPHSSRIEIVVYNLLGEKAAEIFEGSMNAGSHNLTFDASNLSSGVYLLNLSTDEGSITSKLVLMK